MKRAGTVLGLALVAITATATVGGSAQGKKPPTFGINSLQGTYGMSQEVGVSTSRQFAEIAHLELDGEGGCAQTLIGNAAGVATPIAHSVACSYEVAEDGTGSMTIETDDGVTATYTFVIVEGGRVLLYSFTAPTGFQGRGEAVKQ
jgi:hypothetical protein